MTAKKTNLKPSISLDVGHMTPEQRVTFARVTANTAKTSAAFTGSPGAQASMATWQKATDALDANNQSIEKELKILFTLRGQQGPLLYAFDMAASDYASNARLLAISDPTVIPALGLTPRAPATRVASIVAPTELTIKTTRAGVDAVAWAAVPGAHLYEVQISVDPATDATWSPLEGGGRRRKLSSLGLVHGQKYVIRVRALGASQTGPWSANLAYVGK